jgi:uncharacterized protein
LNPCPVWLRTTRRGFFMEGKMLEKLTEVQTHDLSMDALETEKLKTPQALTDLKAEVEALQRKLADRQGKYQEVAKQVKSNDLEMGALSERRKSATASALQAQSSKEASQYQNQELQFATRLEELEADTLPFMERMEQLGEEVAGLEGQLGELNPNLAEMIAQEAARVQDLNIKVVSIKAERDGIASQIESNLLKQYEQVRKSKRGIALALVVDSQRCGGCNVKLPINTIQKVKKAQDVIRCPSCGRILWAK